MHVWNVLHVARWKYTTQKLRKNRHLRTTAQCCWAISSQLRLYRQSEKKLIKQQYLLHMYSQYGELRPTKICWWVLGTPANFNGFRVLASTSLNGGQPNFVRYLAVSWLVHYIYILGLLPPNRILPGAKFTLRPSLAFSYIDSVSQTLRRGTRNGITELSQTAPPTFGRAAIALGIGPHSSSYYDKLNTNNDATKLSHWSDMDALFLVKIITRKYILPSSEIKLILRSWFDPVFGDTGVPDLVRTSERTVKCLWTWRHVFI